MDSLSEGAEIVAHASGRKPNDTRWTELAIFYAPTTTGKPFRAEVVGETEVTNEERRVRWAMFETVSDALAWGAFNRKSALYGELQRKATLWVETRALQLKRRFGTPAEQRRVDRSLLVGAQQLERALELLRKLVTAARDEREPFYEETILAVCDEVDTFLSEVDHAAG